MKRLLTACMALVLAVSALAVAPATPVAPTAQAVDGNWSCGLDAANNAIYNIIDRDWPTAGKFATSIQMDVVFGVLKTCGAPTAGFYGYSQMWLSAQDDSNGPIAQVGYQWCGKPTGQGWDCAGVPAGQGGFVVSSRDDQNEGALVHWSTGPSEVVGHEYRFTIEDLGSQLRFGIKDLTANSNTYYKLITSTWQIDYMWVGCESHNVKDYCGTDSDDAASLQAQTSNMKYRLNDGILYTINNTGGTPTDCEESYTGNNQITILNRYCSYPNADHSVIKFKTSD